MNALLLPLLQGAGAVALAVVAFTLTFTWPSLVAPIQALRSEKARLAGFGALGVALLLAAALVYAAPGLLLRDELGLIVAFPIAATWLIVAAALIVRGLVLQGAGGVISYGFAAVSVGGAATGIVSAVFAQHRIADTITPTGAFLLGLAAIAGIVFWARIEAPEPKRV